MCSSSTHSNVGDGRWNSPTLIKRQVWGRWLPQPQLPLTGHYGCRQVQLIPVICSLTKRPLFTNALSMDNRSEPTCTVVRPPSLTHHFHLTRCFAASVYTLSNRFTVSLCRLQMDSGQCNANVATQVLGTPLLVYHPCMGCKPVPRIPNLDLVIPNPRY